MQSPICVHSSGLFWISLIICLCVCGAGACLRVCVFVQASSRRVRVPPPRYTYTLYYIIAILTGWLWWWTRINPKWSDLTPPTPNPSRERSKHRAIIRTRVATQPLIKSYFMIESKYTNRFIFVQLCVRGKGKINQTYTKRMLHYVKYQNMKDKLKFP